MSKRLEGETEERRMIEEHERLIKEQKEEKRKKLIEKAPLLEMKLIDGNAWHYSEVVKINGMGCTTSKRDSDKA